MKRLSAAYLACLQCAVAIITILVFIAPSHAKKMENITLQLKWFHQFQFAGFYAAKEKGFYKEEGLSVTILERNPQKKIIESVLDGDAEYGVADAGLVLDRMQGRTVVLLKQIFQHSPLILITKEPSGINSPFKLRGKRVMADFNSFGDAPLGAMLNDTIGGTNNVTMIEHTFRPDELLTGKVDAMSAYMTNEPYLLKKRGVKIHVINPRNYGIDFYGDNLFTTEKEIKTNPERVKKMIRATLKGWQYALDHPDEIIRLILNTYNSSKDQQQLAYEARITKKMISPDEIPLGTVLVTRFEDIIHNYIKAGLVQKNSDWSGFLYQKDSIVSKGIRPINLSPEEKTWLEKNPVISVHNEEDGVPFNFNENGRPKGFSIDYMNLIADKIGLKIKHKTGSWNELLEMTKNNQLDVMLNIAKSPERERFLHFSQPYCNLLISLFVREDIKKIRSVEDLYGKRVAVPKGSYVEGLLKKHPKIKIVSVKNTKEAVIAASMGNADALYNIVTIVNYYERKLLIKNLRPEGEVGLSDGKPMPLHIAVSKKNTILASLLNKGMASVDDYEVDQLQNKWMGSHLKKAVPQIHLTSAEKIFLENHPIIKVANDSGWPPFDFFEFGRARGYSMDYLQALAGIIGIKLEFVQDDSWDKLINRFESKKLDVITAYEYLPAHQQFALFTDPFLQTYRSIIIRKGTDFLKNYLDLSGKKVAVVRGYDYEDIIKTNHPGIDMIIVDTPLKGLEKLSFGEVDAFLENSAVASYLIEKHGFPNLMLAGNPDLPGLEAGENIRIAVRKDWPELKAIFFKAMNLVPETTLAQLKKRWLIDRDVGNTIVLNKEEQAWLTKHPMIKVSNELDYPPFDFAVGGKPQGYSIDLLNLIAEKIGIKIEYVNGYSWTELVELFKKRKLHLLHSLSETPDRMQFGLFTKDYVRTKSHFVTLIGNPEITEVTQLYGKTIAAVKGWKQEKFFEMHHPQINLMRVKNVEELLESVSNGDAYAILGNVVVLNYMIKKKGMSGLKVSGWAKEFDKNKSTKYHFMVQKDSPELTSMLNKALALLTIKERSDLDEKWIGVPEKRTPKIQLTPEEKQFIRTHPVIKVSNEQDFPPFDFAVGGRPQGYSIDLLNLIADKIGIQIDYVNGFTWNELVDMFKRHELELLHTLTQTPGREKFGLFSNDYHRCKQYFVTRIENPEINEFSQLIGKTVAVGKAWKSEKFIAAHYPGIKLLRLDSLKEMLEAVSLGKAYATLANVTASKYIIKQKGLRDIKVSGWAKEFDKGVSYKYHFMAQKDAPELISMLNKALAMLTTKERSELDEKWIGGPEKGQTRVQLTPEEQAYLNKKGTIKMCVLPDWLPYERINKNGVHEGIGAEFIQLISQRINTPIELVPTRQWNESLENMRERACDILPIAMDVPSRRESMDFTRPYIVEPFVITTRIDELFIKNAGQIGRRKVGVVKGAAFTEVLQSRHPDLQIVDVENPLDGLKWVRRGELFGYIDSMPTIGYIMQKYSMLDLKIAGKLELDLEISIASRNDEPMLNSIMQKATDSITEEERREIIGHWLSIRFEQGFNYTLLWKILAAVAVVFIAVLFWVHHLAIMNQKIRQANLKAEAANRAKSEFLANMSHEIRTPLNAVTGFSELLSSLVTDEKQKSYLNAIKSSGKNLLMLINDILDLSKIEAGKLEIQYSTVDLRVLLEEMEQIFALQASKKDIQLIIDISNELPPAFQLDEIRLRQILLNLVGNAIKFTEKGFIKLSVTVLSKKDEAVFDIHISVEDTGIGVSQKDIETIFDSFKQQTDQDSSRYGGTGLGLAICKRLVEMMNGRIEVESRTDKGSIFKIIIKDVAAIYKSAPDLKAPFYHDQIEFENGRILVVDDVESNRHFLKELLNKVNLDVLEAQNGHEAIVISPEYQPDVILMDIRMPVMDGFEAAKQLKNNQKTQKIPIIAVTAASSTMEQPEILKKGFDGFLSKPVEISKLLSELAKYLPVAKSYDKLKTKEKNEAEALGALSTEAMSKLPDLILTLDSDFRSQWEGFTSKQPMEEVRKFGLDLKELGIKFDNDSLSNYGEGLVVHVNNFDVNSMKEAIDRFPALVSELKSIKEENL